MPDQHLIVHVGLPKAASSTFQAALVRSRPHHRAHGVAFPALGGGGVKDQHDLKIALTKGRKSAAYGAVFDAIDHAFTKEGARTVVLSGETVWQSPAAHVEAFFADALRRNLRVTTLAILRDPATWLNSRYAFRASLFLEAGTFAPFAKAELARGTVSWGKHFAPFLSHPQCPFLAIPLAAQGDDRPVLNRTLEAAGLPQAFADGAESNRNEALDPRAVEVARRLQALGLDGREAVLRRRARSLLMNAAHDRGWRDKFCGLTPSLAKTIAARTQEGRDALAHRIWGAPWAHVYADPLPERFVSNEAADADDDGVAEVTAQLAEALALAGKRGFTWSRFARRPRFSR
ncbi:MAG: hypothetical protein AAGD34_15395 [Pseudomonadota bacterium]